MAKKKPAARRPRAAARTTRARSTRKTAIPPAAPGPAATAVDDGEAVVVYIHGIGRHLPKDELKLEWDLAVFGRDRGPATRMAYWSDLVHPPQAARRTRGLAPPTSPSTTDAVLAEAGVSSRNQDAREYVEELRRAYGVEEATLAPRRGVRAKVLPLPRFIREPIARAFLKAFLTDTAAYFFDQAKRSAIRQRLIDVLPGRDTPVTLVAHSQGSIVALEVLSEKRDAEHRQAGHDWLAARSAGSAGPARRSAAAQAVPRPCQRRALGQLRRPARSGGPRQAPGVGVRAVAWQPRHAPADGADRRSDDRQHQHHAVSRLQPAFRGGLPVPPRGPQEHPRIGALRYDVAVRGRPGRLGGARPRRPPSGPDRGPRAGVPGRRRVEGRSARSAKAR